MQSTQLNVGMSDAGCPGGYLQLGYVLYQYLTGNNSGFPYVHQAQGVSVCLIELFRGFQSTSRANPLAQKIVKAAIERGYNNTLSYYASDHCKPSRTNIFMNVTSIVGQFLNGTQMSLKFDYNDPSIPYPINGFNEPTSQRFEVRPDYFCHTVSSRGDW